MTGKNCGSRAKKPERVRNFTDSVNSVLLSVTEIYSILCCFRKSRFFLERERERENFVAILERENERVSERQRWGFFLNVGIGGLIWVFLKIWEVGFGGCFLKVFFFLFVREKIKIYCFGGFVGFVGLV